LTAWLSEHPAALSAHRRRRSSARRAFSALAPCST